MKKNLIWWIALAIFAAAALISGIQGAHQASVPPSQEKPESLGDYVIRTCANGPAIVQSVHRAAVARGTRSADRYTLSGAAAAQFETCVHQTQDPLTRDWSIFNYAYWLAASAPEDAKGAQLLQDSTHLLSKLHDDTPYPVVKNGAADLEHSLQGRLDTLKKRLGKGH